jgi:hypothetical protein
VKRSLQFLDQRRDEARAELERRLGLAAERVTGECERAVERHPLLSLGAAGLTGMLAAAALTGNGSASRGRSSGSLSRTVQQLFALRRLFHVP